MLPEFYPEESSAQAATHQPLSPNDQPAFALMGCGGMGRDDIHLILVDIHVPMNRDFLNGERGRLGCADWSQVDAPHRMFGETPNTAGGTPALPIPYRFKGAWRDKSSGWSHLERLRNDIRLKLF